MAGDQRLPLDCRSWNDYCCGFQWTALECVLLHSMIQIFSCGTDGAMLDILPLNTAARTIRTGLYGGIAFGLAQDALGLARGRRLAYVDFLLGRSRDTSEIQEVGGSGI